MNAETLPASTPNTAGKAAWVCLAIAWVTFLVPIPGIGLFIGWPLNLVAFILAIVAMSKRGAGAGLWPLLASLIASPVIYFIGVAVLAGTMGAVGESARQAEATATAEAASTTAVAASPVDPATLFAAYEANEVAADQRYKGARLAITGIIDDITSDFSDAPVVQLRVGEYQSVHAGGLPADVAASLQKGQTITLTCTGAGEVIGTPMLDDCTL